MNTVEEIQKEIESLSHREYIRLAHWFSERDWKTWDKEIERDSKSGKLDFLIEEAFEEKKQESFEICNASNNISFLALLL